MMKPDSALTTDGSLQPMIPDFLASSSGTNGPPMSPRASRLSTVLSWLMNDG
jgi:hypothetical protein